ncbi:MAG: hypothetical protein LWW95_11705 [Candidatus Desulfofervidus auxilii]|nr:hypothetical protein [Candidatus Desulfofervidus auxilii]
MFKKIKTNLYICFLLLFILCIGLSKAFAFEEEDIFATVELAKEESLQEIRGGYMGVYFQVVFTGYWDNLGHSVSILEGDSNSEFSADSVVSLSGTNVRSIALIGGFNGANGIFQINQVPGSNNIIENNLIININIFITEQITGSFIKEMMWGIPILF